MTAAHDTPRLRRLSAALLSAAAALALLTACGGGDELAPPDPVAEGSGLAVVTLDGVEVGSSPLVSSGLASSQDLTVGETGEVVTFEGDPPTATLSRDNLAPDNPPCAFIVTQTAPPMGLYGAGIDYDVDFNNGVFTARLVDPGDPSMGYRIPDGTEVTVDYCYFDTVYSLNVGITLPQGDYFTVTLFNLPGGASGMRTTNQAAGAAPPDGSFAFVMAAAQDLTILGGGRFILLDDPAVNEATVVSSDLSNLLNPCVEGRAVGLVQNTRDGSQAVLEVNFDDPECPS